MARHVAKKDGSLQSTSPSRVGACVRSLPIDRWPTADREAWQMACQPGQRLKRGGALSHLAPRVVNDLARRYSYFLNFLENLRCLDPSAPAGAHITPENLDFYVARLNEGVSSVTVYGSIYKLRRAAQAIAPERDFSWLAEIEKDLAFVMRPRAKHGRFVLTERLVEAGMTLMIEAQSATHRSKLARARQYRNGLMVALLAVCPIRLKNFAALEIGHTFTQINDSWWIVLPRSATKTNRADERRIPDFLTQWVNDYLSEHRPVFDRSEGLETGLWLSRDGRCLSYPRVQKIVTQATFATVGVSVSPHLFRTAGASTAATYGGSMPNLGSALLHHRDPAVTAEHYNRASMISAAQDYAIITRTYRQRY